MNKIEIQKIIGKRLFNFLKKQQVEFWLEDQDELELWWDAPKGKQFAINECISEHSEINNKLKLYNYVKMCFNHVQPRDLYDNEKGI